MSKGNTKQERDLKRYIKEIRSLFPTFGNHEKEFLSGLRVEVENYALSYPDSDYLQFISCFGEPSVIISDYFAKADFSYLSKRIRITKYLKICSAAVVILAVVVAGIKIGIDYKGYLDAKEAYLAVKETEIQQFPGE